MQELVEGRARVTLGIAHRQANRARMLASARINAISVAKQAGRARLRAIVALLLLASLAMAIFLWRDYRHFTDAPLTIPSANATFDVARGATYRAIVDQLRAAGVTRASPWYWRALARELDIEGHVHAGEYALSPGLTPRELLRKMAAGEVLQHYFTVVDGWTFRQLRVALAADAGLAQTLARTCGRRHRATGSTSPSPIPKAGSCRRLTHGSRANRISMC